MTLCVCVNVYQNPFIHEINFRNYSREKCTNFRRVISGFELLDLLKPSFFIFILRKEKRRKTREGKERSCASLEKEKGERKREELKFRV